MGQEVSKKRSYTPGKGKTKLPTAPNNGDATDLASGSVELLSNTQIGLGNDTENDVTRTRSSAPETSSALESSLSDKKKKKKKKKRFFFRLRKSGSGKHSRRSKVDVNGMRPSSFPPLAMTAEDEDRRSNSLFETGVTSEDEGKIDTVSLSSTDEKKKERVKDEKGFPKSKGKVKYEIKSLQGTDLSVKEDNSEQAGSEREEMEKCDSRNDGERKATNTQFEELMGYSQETGEVDESQAVSCVHVHSVQAYTQAQDLGTNSSSQQVECNPVGLAQSEISLKASVHEIPTITELEMSLPEMTQHQNNSDFQRELKIFSEHQTNEADSGGQRETMKEDPFLKDQVTADETPPGTLVLVEKTNARDFHLTVLTMEEDPLVNDTSLAIPSDLTDKEKHTEDSLLTEIDAMLEHRSSALPSDITVRGGHTVTDTEATLERVNLALPSDVTVREGDTVTDKELLASCVEDANLTGREALLECDILNENSQLTNVSALTQNAGFKTEISLTERAAFSLENKVTKEPVFNEQGEVTEGVAFSREGKVTNLTAFFSENGFQEGSIPSLKDELQEETDLIQKDDQTEKSVEFENEITESGIQAEGISLIEVTAIPSIKIKVPAKVTKTKTLSLQSSSSSSSSSSEEEEEENEDINRLPNTETCLPALIKNPVSIVTAKPICTETCRHSSTIESDHSGACRPLITESDITGFSSPLVRETAPKEIYGLALAAETVSTEIIKPSLNGESLSAEINKPSLITEHVSAEINKPSLFTEHVSAEINKPSLFTEPVSAEINEPSLFTEPVSVEINKPSLFTEPVSVEINKPSLFTEPVSVEMNRPSLFTEPVSVEINKPSLFTEPVSAEINKPSFTEPVSVEINKPSFTEPVSVEINKPSFTEHVSVEINKPLFTEPVSVEINKPSLFTEPVSAEINKPSLFTEPVSAEINEPSLFTKPDSVEINKPSLFTEPVSVEINKPSFTEPVSVEINKPSFTEPVSVEINKPSLFTEPVSAEINEPSLFTKPDSVEINKPSLFTEPVSVEINKPSFTEPVSVEINKPSFTEPVSAETYKPLVTRETDSPQFDAFENISEKRQNILTAKSTRTTDSSLQFLTTKLTPTPETVGPTPSAKIIDNLGYTVSCSSTDFITSPHDVSHTADFTLPHDISHTTDFITSPHDVSHTADFTLPHDISHTTDFITSPHDVSHTADFTLPHDISHTTDFTLSHDISCTTNFTSSNNTSETTASIHNETESARKAAMKKEEKEKAKAVKEEEERARAMKEEKERARTVKEEKERAIAVKEEKERARTVKEEKERAIAVKEEKKRARAVKEEEEERARAVKEEKERARAVKEEEERARAVKEEKERARAVKEEEERARAVKEEKERARAVKEEEERARAVKEEKERARVVKEEKRKLKEEKTKLAKEIKDKEKKKSKYLNIIKKTNECLNDTEKTNTSSQSVPAESLHEIRTTQEEHTELQSESIMFTHSVYNLNQLPADRNETKGSFETIPTLAEGIKPIVNDSRESSLEVKNLEPIGHLEEDFISLVENSIIDDSFQTARHLVPKVAIQDHPESDLHKMQISEKQNASSCDTILNVSPDDVPVLQNFPGSVSPPHERISVLKDGVDTSKVLQRIELGPRLRTAILRKSTGDLSGHTLKRVSLTRPLHLSPSVLTQSHWKQHAGHSLKEAGTGHQHCRPLSQNIIWTRPSSSEVSQGPWSPKEEKAVGHCTVLGQTQHVPPDVMPSELNDANAKFMSCKEDNENSKVRNTDDSTVNTVFRNFQTNTESFTSDSTSANTWTRPCIRNVPDNLSVGDMEQLGNEGKVHEKHVFESKSEVLSKVSREILEETTKDNTDIDKVHTVKVEGQFVTKLETDQAVFMSNNQTANENITVSESIQSQEKTPSSFIPNATNSCHGFDLTQAMHADKLEFREQCQACPFQNGLATVTSQPGLINKLRGVKDLFPTEADRDRTVFSDSPCETMVSESPSQTMVSESPCESVLNKSSNEPMLAEQTVTTGVGHDSNGTKCQAASQCSRNGDSLMISEQPQSLRHTYNCTRAADSNDTIDAYLRLQHGTARLEMMHTEENTKLTQDSETNNNISGHRSELPFFNDSFLHADTKQ